MYLTNHTLEAAAAAIAGIAPLASPTGTPNQVSLVNHPFTPGRDLLLGDIEDYLVDDTYGMGPKTQPNLTILAWDPATGTWSVYLKEPVGGYTWISDDAPALPVTIYGIAIVQDGGWLVATQLLATPYVVSAAGQVIALSALVGPIADPPLGS